MENLLALDNIDLLTYVRNKMYSDGEPADLSKPVRMVLAYLELEDQVCNGGFVQYFFNTGGESVDYAIQCTEKCGLFKIHDLIKQGKSLFDCQLQEVRESALLFRTTGRGDYQDYRKANLQMEDLDQSFYSELKEAESKIANFVRENLIHFV
jgi:hypothetical protein